MQTHPSFFFIFLLLISYASVSISTSELDLLMEIKQSLDPTDQLLASWDLNAGDDPCSGSFEGVACNEYGRVANISLQGKGLSGCIPPAIGGLSSLTGLYLHFNSLNGEIPVEISHLTQLSDLYLNVNNLSGRIPPQLSNLSSLQVLQLCYNRLRGSIPTQLGSLSKLDVLALQYNNLTGAIPANLGDLSQLTRLDLSFNSLFGSVPVKLANAPMLQFFDIRNNTLSGNVPPALVRLGDGFQYENNIALCGAEFPNLAPCRVFQQFFPIVTNKPNAAIPKSPIPESANLPPEYPPHPPPPEKETPVSEPVPVPHYGIILGGVGCFLSVAAIIVLVLLWWHHRRRKQKIGSFTDATSDDDKLIITDNQGKEAATIPTSGALSLLSIEYPNGWDPLGNNGDWVSEELMESWMFNLEDVERATQQFSETNLLGKSGFTATYKGILRDGSVVAIKCIAKTSCKSDEAEFLKGLKMLTSLTHESLVKLRGFCCSKGRGECFLVYDFVHKGNLLHYLDVKEGTTEKMVLEWPTRVSIISGIAKGIAYLHGQKKGLVHQNISAKKVMIDCQYNPLLLDSGLHKLLADDVVFSILKASAGMGYLFPEYTTTGRFTEKSDVYAFGLVILQVITGKSNVTHLISSSSSSFNVEDIIDQNLGGNFVESEVNQLVKMALVCIHEAPSQRPNMEDLVREVGELVATP
ncbi:LRR receptor kinase SERK2 [Linum grandiflorum]